MNQIGRTELLSVLNVVQYNVKCWNVNGIKKFSDVLVFAFSKALVPLWRGSKAFCSRQICV